MFVKEGGGSYICFGYVALSSAAFCWSSIVRSVRQQVCVI